MNCVVCEFIKGEKFPHYGTRKDYKEKACLSCRENESLIIKLESEGMIRDS